MSSGHLISRYFMALLTKDQVWEQTFDTVARTVDGMGRRIDPKIIWLVLALNASGIPTTFSCEGHLDHGHSYPWVWVPINDLKPLSELLTAFYQTRKQDIDRMLVIVCNFVDEKCVLQSMGAVSQNERKPRHRAKKLKEYQAEMDAFATFLTERFFDE
jgi:hypothetical protein